MWVRPFVVVCREVGGGGAADGDGAEEPQGPLDCVFFFLFCLRRSCGARRGGGRHVSSFTYVVFLI